jgi:hypothetical protein
MIKLLRERKLIRDLRKQAKESKEILKSMREIEEKMRAEANHIGGSFRDRYYMEDKIRYLESDEFLVSIIKRINDIQVVKS